LPISGATSYHAILFAGNTNNRSDYWNDDAVEPPGEIPIDGAATRQNLLNGIAALQGVMNQNEQLYIFIGDHGSSDMGHDVVEIPPVGTKQDSNTFRFEALEEYHIDALNAPENTSGPYLELIVTSQFGPISSNWEVYFNDQPVNFGDNVIPGGQDEAAVRFLIDPVFVDYLYNDVWIRNVVSDDTPIAVELTFAMGDLNTVLVPRRISPRAAAFQP